MDVWQETKKILKAKNIPLEVILEVTRRCNLKCCHCYNVKDNRELTTVQVKDVIDQLREAGCLFLVLTGGEVFIRPDFIDIVKYSRHRGLDVKIFTNGTLVTDDIAYELGKLKPNEVGVSVYGATALTHEKITGVKGSFDATVSGITKLKGQGVAVHIKCTLMKENIAEVENVKSMASDLGVTYIIDPTVSPKDDGTKGVLKHRVRAEDLKRIYTEEFAKVEYDGDEEFFICDAGQIFGSISASGDVYPCVQLPLSVGNVFKEDFKDIWQTSPILQKMRKAKAKDFHGCNSCAISNYCSRCPGLAYIEDGDLFGPL